jgi:hypothetical protein
MRLIAAAWSVGLCLERKQTPNIEHGTSNIEVETVLIGRSMLILTVFSRQPLNTCRLRGERRMNAKGVTWLGVVTRRLSR